MSSSSVELKPITGLMGRPDTTPYRDDDDIEEDQSNSWSGLIYDKRNRRTGFSSSSTLSSRLSYVGLLLVCALIAFFLGWQAASKDSVSEVIPDFLKADILSHEQTQVDAFDEVPRLQRLPPNTRIVGLVFYGRPIFVDVLDCYLRKNLKANGGILDEVRFVLHTAHDEDIAWLEDLVKRDGLQNDYKLVYEDEKITAPVWVSGGVFSYLWGKYATDADTIYVKIDDDLVYIEDGAIPRMVNSLLAHPEAHSIQANIINSRFTHWLHHTTGAILPFLPNPSTEIPPLPTDWRPSKLPTYPVSALPPGLEPVMKHYIKARYQNPQWLPLPPTAKNLLRTPFGDGYDLPDPKTGEKDPAPRWPLAAQEHYSFLSNLEEKKLGRYWFGRPSDGLWNTWFQHYNINFMVFWGRTIALRPFWNQSDPSTFLEKDEMAITMDVPRELGMPVYVDTRAIVSHFAFHGSHQRDGLLQTDLLDRYRLLANGFACAADNQKERWEVELPFQNDPDDYYGETDEEVDEHDS